MEKKCSKIALENTFVLQMSAVTSAFEVSAG